MPFIYCIFNQYFFYYGSDVYKLGRALDVEKRTNSVSTFALDNYIVKYSKEVEDEIKAEKILFQILDIYRITNSREFFKVSLPIIKLAMDRTSDILSNNVPYIPPEKLNFLHIPIINENKYDELKANQYNTKFEKQIIEKYEYLNDINDKISTIDINSLLLHDFAQISVTSNNNVEYDEILRPVEINDRTIISNKLLLYKKYHIDFDDLNFIYLWYDNYKLFDINRAVCSKKKINDIKLLEKIYYLEIILMVYGFENLFDSNAIKINQETIDRMESSKLLEPQNYYSLMNCFNKRTQSQAHQFSLKRYNDISQVILNEFGFSLSSKRKRIRDGPNFSYTYMYTMNESITNLRQYLIRYLILHY